MLTDATRQQVQRLRFLLEEALSRTQDQTPVGRHMALVLLDGACEHAMGLALGYQGLSTERGFPRKFEELQSALTGWKPDTWAAVLQLHEARNLAQHQGISPDASHMPVWAAQAQRFIDSLVTAAFATELRAVLVANSIETAGVRHMLVEAEHGLAQEDATTAFSAAIAGFDAARAAWQGQRAEAIGQLTLEASRFRFTDSEEIDPVNRSLIRFEDLLEVQPFAPDIAEYHWFVVRRSEVAQDLEPSLDDARRAFQFVVAWVLRWEAFASRYKERRYPSPPPSYEPPVTGADHPVIYGADVEIQHHLSDLLDVPTVENVRYSVRVTLADVPGEDRELWAKQTGNVLNEIIAERAQDRVAAARVGTSGIVFLHGVASATTGDEIQGWIMEAVAKGDQRYRQQLAERKQLGDRLPALRARFEEALGTVDTDQLLSGVTSDARDDGTIWIGVQLQTDDADPLLQHLLDQAVNPFRSGRTDIDYFRTTLWFRTDHDPHDAATLVAAIAGSYREQAAARRSGLAAVDARRQALETELREYAASDGS